MTPAETAILPRLGVVFSRNLLTMICTMGLFAGLRHRISLFQNDICCLHAIYLGFYMLAFMLNLYLFQRNGMKSLPRKVLLGCTILSFLIYVLGFVCTGFIALIEPKALLALSAAPGDLMAQIATTAVKEESAFTAGAWPLNLNIIIGDALVAWRAWAVWSDRKSVKIILMIMAILNALLCIADAAFDDATLLAPSSIEGTPVPIDVTTLAFSFALNLAATSLIGLKACAHLKNDDDEDAVYLEVEESRELTHEEVWDDSALIEAWNAATEEYQAYNGPDKGWKDEPIHKSPLWYNDPPPPSKKQKTSPPSPPIVHVNTGADAVSALKDDGRDVASLVVPEPEEADSNPIDFSTFIPTYDAGLALPGPHASADGHVSAPYVPTNYTAAASPAQMVSQDEAFKRALEATYWSGYWTAVYHMKGTVPESADKNKEGKMDIGDGQPEVDSTGEAEGIEEDAHVVLDIGDDGKFEADEFVLDDDSGEHENGLDEDAEEEEEDGDDSRGFVSTQR
ncbi:hypothetical protein D9757_007280 [Collybiopsis confluens]|uniref:Survival Motor Neuron Gemin2-binding domain-containing protein n=1 Tax=Collybiopsis confluens TaxID=2823264 RepID=A0A8H5HG77_9AGAR|nr:hypothetical protein D9757_007280 [Collybiopsis confluens]